MRNNEKAMKNIREAAELIASLATAPHPAPDATDWKARCEAADAALQRIGMTLGSFDEWTSQGNMIADVEDRVTAAQAENEKLRAERATILAHRDRLIGELRRERTKKHRAETRALSPPPLSPETPLNAP